MVNQGHFGTGREGAPRLAQHAKLLLPQIPPQNIKEGDNIKECQQDQTPPPLCRLLIWKSSQEAMDKKSQILRRVNQETVRDQNRGHDLN